MKLFKTMLGIGVLALGVASAASSAYNVTIYDSLSIGQTELKPGDYKVEMEGEKAVFTNNKKNTFEVPAKMGTNEKKFASNSVVTEGKQIVEIDFKGSTAKMLFSK